MRYGHLSGFNDILLDPVELLFNERPVICIALIGRHLRVWIADLQVASKDACDSEPFGVVF
jgi:hypothetical protein